MSRYNFYYRDCLDKEDDSFDNFDGYITYYRGGLKNFTKMYIPRIPEIVCENFYRKDDFVNAFLTPEETSVIDDNYAGIVVNTTNWNRLIIPA